MTDLVSQYLNEIGVVPLLDAQRERELSQAIEKGILATEQKQVAEDQFGPLTASNLAALRAKANRATTDKNAKTGSKTTTKTTSKAKPTRKSKTEVVAPPSMAQVRTWDRSIREGEHAKEQFIKSNLRLVVSVARRYPLPPGMELLDLIQEGNLGLEHAVDKFEWRKGFKFSTYATFWIRQSIGRALDQRANLVRLPGDRAAALRAALRESSGDGNELDAEQAMLHRLTTPAALDRTVGEDGTTELMDLLPDSATKPDDKVAELDHSNRLFGIVRTELDERSFEAVQLRLGLYDSKRRSYREVGEQLGITAEAARRLVNRALSALKKSIPLDLLEEFPNLLDNALADTLEDAITETYPDTLTEGKSRKSEASKDEPEPEAKVA